MTSPHRTLALPILIFSCFGLQAVTAAVQAAPFQMMKRGEWKIETLESSLGPFAKTVKTKPFCIDKAMDQKGWEERAKEEMKKAGIICELKPLKVEALALTYETHCTPAPPEAGKKSSIPQGAKLDGQITLTRVNENEYLMDQVAKGTGLSLPQVDLSKVPEAQRKLLEGALGGSSFQIMTKQKYIFAQERCRAS